MNDAQACAFIVEPAERISLRWVRQSMVHGIRMSNLRHGPDFSQPLLQDAPERPWLGMIDMSIWPRN